MALTRFTLVLIFLWTSSLGAQTVSSADSSLFDFWVGEWELTWMNAEGDEKRGSNRIEKILDGRVIQEHFSDAAGNFRGTSISVYNTRRNTWHQAWADNQGGYYDFIGGVDDGRPVFRTQPFEVNGKTLIQRMVFYDIKANSFTWDWEKSTDGGENWELMWRIWYQRVE